MASIFLENAGRHFLYGIYVTMTQNWLLLVQLMKSQETIFFRSKTKIVSGDLIFVVLSLNMNPAGF